MIYRMPDQQLCMPNLRFALHCGDISELSYLILRFIRKKFLIFFAKAIYNREKIVYNISVVGT